MTDQELKFEILKLVHKGGVSPKENIDYANAYFTYLTEKPQALNEETLKKPVTKK
jgi:hypothetical protein